MEVKNYNNLLVEIEDGIAVITINRPKSLNALNSETLAELGDIAAAIEKAKDVKVVIRTEIFCRRRRYLRNGKCHPNGGARHGIAGCRNI